MTRGDSTCLGALGRQISGQMAFRLHREHIERHAMTRTDPAPQPESAWAWRTGNRGTAYAAGGLTVCFATQP